jgi:hypothetical protein
MTAADTPPVVLVGGPEADRTLLKSYLERNKVGCLANVASPEEAVPSVLTQPECTVVFVRPTNFESTREWLVGRKAAGFTGRVGVIAEPSQIGQFLGKPRWNDFALKVPVPEPDFLGAVRSASRQSERTA